MKDKMGDTLLVYFFYFCLTIFWYVSSLNTKGSSCIKWKKYTEHTVSLGHSTLSDLWFRRIQLLWLLWFRNIQWRICFLNAKWFTILTTYNFIWFFEYQKRDWITSLKSCYLYSWRWSHNYFFLDITPNHIDIILITLLFFFFFPPPQVIPVWFYRLKKRLLKWKMYFQ